MSMLEQFGSKGSIELSVDLACQGYLASYHTTTDPGFFLEWLEYELQVQEDSVFPSHLRRESSRKGRDSPKDVQQRGKTASIFLGTEKPLELKSPTLMC